MHSLLKEITSTAKIVTIGLLVGVGVSIVLAQSGGWSGPTLPPPGGNPPAPINAGIGAQAKQGALSVGTVNPPDVNYKLDVYGSISSRGLYNLGNVIFEGDFKLLDNGAGEGKVLTSDAEGKGTWQTLSGGGGVAGVSKILAGSGVTVSPTAGTGEVTVSATGGGSATKIIAGNGIGV